MNLVSQLPAAAVDLATFHVRDILTLALAHDYIVPGGNARSAVIVSDARSPLSVALAEAYLRALPGAAYLDFDSLPQAAILAAFATLVPGDLVVLIQSTNFRLEAFRIRVELFKRGLKVIEHPHLERMQGPEALLYIDALAYDPAYYRGVGHALRDRIDAAGICIIESARATGPSAPRSEPAVLTFTGPFEPAKLNVGDYAGMQNVGGQYPIGEVFTEARDHEAVNGRARIFVFADADFMVNRPPSPITIVIEKGRIAAAIDSTPEFERVLANIRADEGEVWVRELGFGMNRAFSPDRIVRDIGTLERMCGIHLSLGAKHAVYKKPAFNRREARHHVDVFVATNRVWLDEGEVFRAGGWTVTNGPSTDV